MTILQFFNQHSYLLICAIVLGVVAIALFRRHARRAWLIWLGVLAVAVAGWFALRTGSGTQLNSVEDYEAALRAGQPTLVEFYSDY
jgi:4-amino-4-deoxy-L-arabinose transferase-like glycosyltransferase